MLNFDHKARVFKDEVLQRQLNNEGFVVIDFMNDAEVQRLYTSYSKFFPQGVNGIHIGAISNDTQYRADTDKEIRKEIQRGIEAYFFDYTIHCGIFIVKGPDEQSTKKTHQDMTLVNESTYTGINIWVPLVNLTETNGAIAVLPRSHRLLKTYRGGTLPNSYTGMEGSLEKLMQPLYLKAGQAIVFDQSIIHFSPANRSKLPRPVINAFITHKDASIEVCYWNKSASKNEIEIIEQASDFMLKFQDFAYDNAGRPNTGYSKGFVPYDFPKITHELLKQEYNFTEPELVDTKAPKRKPFIELFKKLFSEK
jgi:hypothetical protein